MSGERKAGQDREAESGTAGQKAGPVRYGKIVNFPRSHALRYALPPTSGDEHNPLVPTVLRGNAVFDALRRPGPAQCGRREAMTFRLRRGFSRRRLSIGRGRTLAVIPRDGIAGGAPIVIQAENDC
jgi:hypothetical protein